MSLSATKTFLATNSRGWFSFEFVLPKGLFRKFPRISTRNDAKNAFQVVFGLLQTFGNLSRYLKNARECFKVAPDALDDLLDGGFGKSHLVYRSASHRV